MGIDGIYLIEDVGNVIIKLIDKLYGREFVPLHISFKEDVEYKNVYILVDSLIADQISSYEYVIERENLIDNGYLIVVSESDYNNTNINMSLVDHDIIYDEKTFYFIRKFIDHAISYRRENYNTMDTNHYFYTLRNISELKNRELLDFYRYELIFTLNDFLMSDIAYRYYKL